MTDTPEPKKTGDESVGAFERADGSVLARADGFYYYGLIGLLTLLVASKYLIVPVRDWIRGEQLGIYTAISTETRTVGSVEVTPDGVRDAVTVTLDQASVADRVMVLAAGSILVVAVLIGAIMAIRLIRDLAANQIFTDRNAEAIEAIGYVLGAGWLVGSVIGWLVAERLVPDSSGIDPRMNYPLTIMLLAGALIVVSRAFRIGSSLQEENAHVI